MVLTYHVGSAIVYCYVVKKAGYLTIFHKYNLVAWVMKEIMSSVDLALGQCKLVATVTKKSYTDRKSGLILAYNCGLLQMQTANACA